MKTILGILLFTVNAFAGANESCEPRIVYIERTVEIEKEVYFHTETKVKVDITRKNRLSLLGGYGPTDNLKYQVLSPSSVQVENVNRANLGLMYQKDLGKLTVGVFGLTNETMGLSLGLNW